MLSPQIVVHDSERILPIMLPPLREASPVVPPLDASALAEVLGHLQNVGDPGPDLYSLLAKCPVLPQAKLLIPMTLIKLQFAAPVLLQTNSSGFLERNTNAK